MKIMHNSILIIIIYEIWYNKSNIFLIELKKSVKKWCCVNIETKIFK